MTAKVQTKSLFENESHFEPVKKTAMQEIKEKKDFSILSLDDRLSANEVRSVLKYAKNVLNSLTLDGSWEDDELRTFTPYMNDVTSLHLVNTTFTNAAFDEAFISDLCHENPFQEALELKHMDEDEWEAADRSYEPPPRPPIYIDLSTGKTHKTNVNCPQLRTLTIENPKGLTVGFLAKLLPLKDHLTTLTLIGCPGNITSETLRSLFPKLQTIVIK